MTRPNDAATARPHSNDIHDGKVRRGLHAAQDGLTKREMFAAMALQGLCASFTPGHVIVGPEIAAVSVQLADLLIQALNAESGAACA